MDPDKANTDERIRDRALQLWEQRGRPEGYESEFWEQAKRELKSEADGGRTSTRDAVSRSGGGSDGPR
jgi:hypothetical protein